MLFPIEFVGFPDTWVEARVVGHLVQQRLFKTIGSPPMRSEKLVVINDSTRDVPMYVSNVAFEMIYVVLDRHLPWKFAYQFGHELGHMSARSDTRHPRVDGLMWIEEALCECHSLIAMASLAQSGPRRENAEAYLVETLSEHSAPNSDGSESWYATHTVELKAATSLVDAAKVAARYIYQTVDADRILADNRLLIGLPVDLGLAKYLQAWEDKSGPGTSVPRAIAELVSL